MPLTEIDHNILTWLDIKAQASDINDVAGQVEAECEIDRLLELRFAIPSQRTVE